MLYISRGGDGGVGVKELDKSDGHNSSYEPRPGILFCVISTDILTLSVSDQEDQALRAGRREEAQGTDDPVLTVLETEMLSLSK